MSTPHTYDFTPCPDHPGRNVSHSPCDARLEDGSRCGKVVADRPRPLHLVPNPDEGNAMQDTATPAPAKAKRTRKAPAPVDPPLDERPTEPEAGPQFWCIEHFTPTDCLTACPNAAPDLPHPESLCFAFSCDNRAPRCFAEPAGHLEDCGQCSDAERCLAADRAAKATPAEPEPEAAAEPEPEPEPEPETPAATRPDPTPTPPARILPPDYRVVDANTGKLAQLSLEGAAWLRYKIRETALSLSYGGKVTDSELDGIVCGGELRSGAIVEITLRGIVTLHAPTYKKGAHEGKTVITCKAPTCIEVIRYAGGPVEASQNVDGEPKVEEDLHEPASAPEATTATDEGPSEDEPAQTCGTCKHELTDASAEPCKSCGADHDYGAWEPAAALEVSGSCEFTADLTEAAAELLEPEDQAVEVERPQCYAAFDACLPWTKEACLHAAACEEASA